ncbi:MAG: ABC transporter substrate-binding protein [Propionibacteriaceae bacterium]
MKKLSVTCMAVALVAVLSACNGPSGTPLSGSKESGASDLPQSLAAVNTTASFYNQLPAQIQQKGKLVVGSEVGYPPMEYYDTDGKTILGFDKALSDVLSQKLGVPVEWQNSNFDGLITQLDSGRVDLVMASMMDSSERQQKADFVDYYLESSVLLSKAGNPNKISTMNDLCGKKATVQRGTNQESVMEKQSNTCVSAGNKAIEILAFDKESDALLQVKQGRAVATLESAAVAAYNTVQSSNAYEVVSQPVPETESIVGIAVSKSNSQLRDVLQYAMSEIMADGSYDKAMKAYGLTTGKLPEIAVNAGK